MTFPAFANGEGTETVMRVTALSGQLSTGVIKRNIGGWGRGKKRDRLDPNREN